MIIQDLPIAYSEDDLIYTEQQPNQQGATMKHTNINKQALKLAHNIKGAYKSFRSALLVAYKILKDAHAKQQILNGLAMAQVKLSALGNKKWIAVSNAWLVVYNFESLT